MISRSGTAVLFLNMVPFLGASVSFFDVQTLENSMLSADSLWNKSLHRLPSTLIGSLVLHKNPIVSYILANVPIQPLTLSKHLVDKKTGNCYPTTFTDGDYAIFSPSGDLIATVDRFACLVKIWNTDGRHLSTLQGHSQDVFLVTFNQSEKMLVTSSLDKTAKIWDLTGQCLMTLKGHTKGVATAIFNDQGDRIITTSYDWTAKLWDSSTEVCINTFKSSHESLMKARFNKEGNRILIRLHEETAHLWDSFTGLLLHTFRGHTGLIESAEFSPDGAQLLTGSTDRTAKIWDLISGDCLATLQGHTCMVHVVDYNTAGNMMVTVSSDACRLWNSTSRQCLFTIRGDRFESCRSAEFTSQGDILLIGLSSGKIQLWDVLSESSIRTLQGVQDKEIVPHISKQGDRLVTCSYDGEMAGFGSDETYQGPIQLWHIGTLITLYRFFKRDDVVTLPQAYTLDRIGRIIEKVKDYGPTAETVFDFTKSPHLQEAYEKLPAEVQSILTPFVRKTTGSRVPNLVACSTT